MPRRDRTYRADDVLRIYLNYLDEEEQDEVDLFFSGIDTDIFDETLDIIVDLLGLIPVFGEPFEFAGTIRDILQFLERVEQNRDSLERVRRLRR